MLYVEVTTGFFSGQVRQVKQVTLTSAGTSLVPDELSTQVAVAGTFVSLGLEGVALTL